MGLRSALRAVRRTLLPALRRRARSLGQRLIFPLGLVLRVQTSVLGSWSRVGSFIGWRHHAINIRMRELEGRCCRGLSCCTLIRDPGLLSLLLAGVLTDRKTELIGSARVRPGAAVTEHALQLGSCLPRAFARLLGEVSVSFL